jgi:hypothetical protein
MWAAAMSIPPSPEEAAAAPDTASAPDAPAPRAESLAALLHEDWSAGAWVRLFRDLYFSFDRRTLGFARIMLGFLLTMDILHRGRTWMDMYSSVGVLPTPLNLLRPQAYGAFTIFNAFDTPGELRVLWVVMLVNALCLLVGYKTKVAQVLAVLFTTGMNGRILLIENGGYVVNNLLVMWTAFLPMGDRFSVDAVLASMKRRREASADELNDRSDMVPPGKETPHVTLLGLVLLVQLAAIYYFNVIHKTGPAWKNGTAVHYVLYVDRMATPIVSLVRDRLPNAAILFMTKSTLIFEATIPIVLLEPLARAWARRIAVVMINTLHLAFGITFVLGPFAWSLCVFSTLLFSSDDWEIAARTMRRPRRARVVVFDPRSGGALFACRLLKRLDRFELLTFAPREGVPLGVGVEHGGPRSGAPPGEAGLCPRTPDAGGALEPRAEALADVVAALPLGPIPAAFLRLPGVRSLADAALAALEKRDLSAFFGLGLGPRRPAPPGPSALRRFRGAVVVTLRELLIAAMFAGAVNQALTELWCVNRRVKVPQPEALRILAHKLRFLQGWFMFSPNPVTDDGTIVVDAITVDGRHIDPFTGKEPFFDMLSVGSLGMTQTWCDYYNRIQLPQNSGYREAMKDYMYRLPDRTGRPEDAIVSGDVYWVKNNCPRWGDTKKWGLDKTKLFSFENPAMQHRATR